MGHRQDEAVGQALTAMGEDVLWLKVLGSYPEGPMPRGAAAGQEE